MVAGLGAENSCRGRQEQIFVAGIRLFHTRIKGLTRKSGFQKLENNKSRNPKI